MNKTRRLGSPKLNIAYVTDALFSGKRLALVEKLLDNGNAVAVGSLGDAAIRAWRSYSPSLNGSEQAFDLKSSFCADALVFGPEALRGRYRVLADSVADRYYSARNIFLADDAFDSSLGGLARRVEDAVYFSSDPIVLR